MDMTTASPPAWSPDWSKVSEQIACPLCDYDLRGLAESRCPECGYRFNWNELFDPARRKHPYLFEHHPERNVASFFHTKVEGTMRPFHDARHSSITNSAAAGFSPAALMARAGHSDFKTTQGYIDLAGETFRDEAEMLERRLGLAAPTAEQRDPVPVESPSRN